MHNWSPSHSVSSESVTAFATDQTLNQTLKPIQARIVSANNKRPSVGTRKYQHVDGFNTKTI
eukprot:4634676-Pyramimonas_sp.AAC.1